MVNTFLDACVTAESDDVTRKFLPLIFGRSSFTTTST